MAEKLTTREEIEAEEHNHTMTSIKKGWRLLDEKSEGNGTTQVFDTGEGNIYLRVSDDKGCVIRLTFLGEV